MAIFFIFKVFGKLLWFLFDRGILQHWISAGVAIAMGVSIKVLAKPRRLRKKGNPAITKKVIEVVVGGWLGKKMTNAWWAGTTIPLPFFVLILYWTGPAIPEVHPLVRDHEWIHVRQNVDAKWWFAAWYRYIKEWMVEAWKHTDNKMDFLKPWKWYQIYGNGYFSNKYEVQAYAVEYADRDNNTIPDWV